MPPGGLLDVNEWARPWESLLATANLGDIEALGVAAAPNAKLSDTAEFAMARRRYQRGLIEGGPGQWNAWAERMMAQDRGLRGSRQDAVWQAVTHVDLSGETIAHELNVATFVFPGRLSLAGTRLDSYFTATAMRVRGPFDLTGASLARDAAIDRCVFEGEVIAKESRWLAPSGQRTCDCRQRSLLATSGSPGERSTGAWT